MCAYREVVWRIRALEVPGVFRHCSGCRGERRFVSSGNFRLNAQGRRVDVWLIYRCTVCDATWNHSLWTRAEPRAIGEATYEALLANDPGLAWSVAFDRSRLAAAGGRPEAEVPWRVEGDAVDLALAVRWQLHLRLIDPCKIRLDRLLAQGLGIARSRLRRWMRRDRLQVAGAANDGRCLRRPVRDGQIVFLGGDSGRIGEEVDSEVHFSASSCTL